MAAYLDRADRGGPRIGRHQLRWYTRACFPMPPQSRRLGKCANQGTPGRESHPLAALDLMVRPRSAGFFVVSGVIFSASLVPAQTCDTLLGAANCGSKSPPQNAVSSRYQDGRAPVQPDWRFGNDPGGLGGDLSFGGDQPGIFGAITFSGRGTTCSGPFRSRNC